eukprot:11966508-Heterocapsa_arctica.AAC.1
MGRRLASTAYMAADSDCILVLHGLCIMHQVSLAVNAMMKVFEVMVPLCCSAVLPHRAHNMTVVKNCISKRAHAELEVTQTQPAPENRVFLEKVMEQLEGGWERDS